MKKTSLLKRQILKASRKWNAKRSFRVLYHLGKCQGILKGHTDAVRGICIISPDAFLSCSNDATIRRWSVAGMLSKNIWILIILNIWVEFNFIDSIVLFFFYFLLILIYCTI